MIKNERQYKITRSQADKFELALKRFNELALIEQGVDPILIKAQRDALASQLLSLNSELNDYEALKSGVVDNLQSTISKLGIKLVEARIAQGLTQKDLASRLGMKEQQVQRYEKDLYSSASLERLTEIAEALGVELQFELNLEKPSPPSTDQLDIDAEIAKLPKKTIWERGWLKEIDRTATKTDMAAALRKFIAPAIMNQTVALLRQGKRVNAELDDHALLAWKARIIWKVRQERAAPKPNFSDLSWLQSLREFTFQQDGPALAVEYLRSKGFHVVFEQHLPKTQLDGAAMLVDDSEFTIALTLRHDRLDNFWFVLLHELGHILQHRDSGLRSGFFDSDEIRAVDKLEREADEFAKSTLLPTEFWLSSLIRFSQSTEQILDFAKENRISPAIIAGWIRRERNDYTIFKDLVGYGKVSDSLKRAGLLEA